MGLRPFVNGRASVLASRSCGASNMGNSRLRSPFQDLYCGDRPFGDKKLVALNPDKKTLPETTVFCRGRQFFVQTVPSAGKPRFKFITRQASKHGGHNVEVKVDVSDKVGTPVDSFVVASPEKEYVLESAKENTYLFTVNSRGNECAVVSSLPGQGMRADSRLRLCARDGQNFWFVVPASSTKVELEVIASVGSPLSAKVLYSSGKEVSNLDKIREGHIVKIPKKKNCSDEIWCLSVSECLGSGCFGLRIGGNAISVISGIKDAVLCY